MRFPDGENGVLAAAGLLDSKFKMADLAESTPARQVTGGLGFYDALKDTTVASFRLRTLYENWGHALPGNMNSLSDLHQQPDGVLGTASATTRSLASTFTQSLNRAVSLARYGNDGRSRGSAGGSGAAHLNVLPDREGLTLLRFRRKFYITQIIGKTGGHRQGG